MEIKDFIQKAKDIQRDLSALSACEVLKPRISIEVEEKTDIYDLVITDNGLRKYTRKLFIDGHHARAVEEGYKYLCNLVKKRSEIIGEDGASLMKRALTPNKPILALNALSSRSEKDEQLGYMEIYAGCMTGIRNPRAHEHEWEDSESRAIQLLTLANHLVEKIILADKRKI